MAATCLGEQAQCRALWMLSAPSSQHAAGGCAGGCLLALCSHLLSLHSQQERAAGVTEERNNCWRPVDVATTHAFFALPPALPSPRKRKLLEKQKEGKKRMRRLGSVDVPQEVFHELMKAGSGK